jgi:hypothetical protein
VVVTGLNEGAGASGQEIRETPRKRSLDHSYAMACPAQLSLIREITAGSPNAKSRLWLGCGSTFTPLTLGIHLADTTHCSPAASSGFTDEVTSGLQLSTQSLFCTYCTPDVKMKVKITKWNAVATWRWDIPEDDVCGICQVHFDGTCPTCKYPGDDCPLCRCIQTCRWLVEKYHADHSLQYLGSAGITSTWFVFLLSCCASR